MAQAVILHGTGGNPDNHWFGWLAAELQNAGYTVLRPALPDPENPDVVKNTAYLNTLFTPDADTILIGHSSGCPLIIHYLNQTSTAIAKAVLVAGFYTVTGKNMPQNVDWARVKNNCAEFYMLASDNDPWGCNPAKGEYLRERVGGTNIGLTGHGHFGSTKFNQPYKEFPLLRDICLLPPQKTGFEKQ